MPSKTTTPRSFEEDASAELGYKGLLAPLTFICVFGYKAQTAFFKYAGIAVTDQQIVQVDQVLKFDQPIVAGDKLYCDVYVDSTRVAHGTQLIVTKNIITNEAGDVVQETYTTLAGRAGEDGEEGFSAWRCVSSVRCRWATSFQRRSTR